jgi:putative heme-binding domain-containing protein
MNLSRRFRRCDDPDIPVPRPDRAAPVERRRRRSTSTVIRRVGPLLGLLSSLLIARLSWAVDDEPSASVQGWVNRQLLGSPEPPLPFTVESRFPSVTWTAPIYVAREPESSFLWVVLQGGEPDRPGRLVRIVDDPHASSAETLLELPGELIYSVCFSLDYRKSGHIYLFTNSPVGSAPRYNRLSRWQVVDPERAEIDLQSRLDLLEWASEGHDGGDMAFGPDQLLYLTAGDGTSTSDLWNTAQDLSRIQGSLLRIDVRNATDAQPYRIPPENPFVELPNARGEIFAYGLRNPWRMSIDWPTGDIWVGNNGQDLWETAHLVRRGDNLGWSLYEGSHPFNLNRQRGPTPVVLPTIEHHHIEARSLTGGLVYRGRRFPELQGVYIYGDYSTGKIWGVRHEAGQVVWQQELADTVLQIASFGLDSEGELLIVDHGGGIYTLVHARVPDQPFPAFPQRLSQAGLFASTAEHRIEPGLLPYEVCWPAWMDGGQAERFVGLPPETRIGYRKRNGFELPNDTVLMQTISLPSGSLGPGSRNQRLETRLLVRRQGEWQAYSYLWRPDQSDADLVPREGQTGWWTERGWTEQPPAADEPAVAWRLPARSECMTCHSRAANFVLGFSAAQLNRPPAADVISAALGNSVAERSGEAADTAPEPMSQPSQLALWQSWHLFDDAPSDPAANAPRLASPDHANDDLELAARSYLHVNCAMCHVTDGGGNALIKLDFSTSPADMQLLSARPQHANFGLPNAMLVAPGAPHRSVLLERIKRTESGQMPPVGRIHSDPLGVQLIEAWIASLPDDNPLVQHWTFDDLAGDLKTIAGGYASPAGPRAAGTEVDQLAPRPSGAEIFHRAGCQQCHRRGNEGGVVGPDLSQVARRLAPEQLLRAIVDPSSKISDAYANWQLLLDSGQIVSGRIEQQDDAQIWLRTEGGSGPRLVIDVADIEAKAKSAVSSMPSGTLDTLHREEIMALLAYLLTLEE